MVQPVSAVRMNLLTNTSTLCLQEVVESSKVRLENGVPRHPSPSYGGPTHLFPHAPQSAMDAVASGFQQSQQHPHHQHHHHQQELPYRPGSRPVLDPVEVEKSNMVMLVSVGWDLPAAVSTCLLLPSYHLIISASVVLTYVM